MMNNYQDPSQQIIRIPDHGRLLPAVDRLFGETKFFPEKLLYTKTLFCEKSIKNKTVFFRIEMPYKRGACFQFIVPRFKP
jgi:hypothetical protein